MTRILAVILFPVLGGWAWFSLWKSEHETARKLSTWTPVEVERTTRIVPWQHGPKLRGVDPGTTIAVVHRYQHGDRQVTLPQKEDPPIEEMGPIFQHQAKEMEDALRAGRPIPAGPNEVVDTVNAYANPKRPEELYFHHPRFRLLFPMLMPMVILIICVMGMLVGQPHTRPQPPRRTNKPPWRKLVQPRTTGRAIIENLIVAAAWCAMVYFACSIYFRVYQPVSTEARVSATLFGLATLAPLMLALFYVWVTLIVRQPIVLINVPFLTRGETFAVRLRQEFRGRRRVQCLRLGLLCLKEYTRRRWGRTVRRAVPVYSEFAQLTPEEHLAPGTVLKFEQTFHVPAEAEPSTSPEAWNTVGSMFFMEHFSWYVRVEMKLPWLPSLKADFPVRVE